MPCPLDGQRAREVLKAAAYSSGVLAGIDGRREVDDPPASPAGQEDRVDERVRGAPARIQAGTQRPAGRLGLTVWPSRGKRVSEEPAPSTTSTSSSPELPASRRSAASSSSGCSSPASRRSCFNGSSSTRASRPAHAAATSPASDASAPSSLASVRARASTMATPCRRPGRSSSDASMVLMARGSSLLPATTRWTPTRQILRRCLRILGRQTRARRHFDPGQRRERELVERRSRRGRRRRPSRRRRRARAARSRGPTRQARPGAR
jgi:hypothetical protein